MSWLYLSLLWFLELDSCLTVLEKSRHRQNTSNKLKWISIKTQISRWFLVKKKQLVKANLIKSSILKALRKLKKLKKRITSLSTLRNSMILIRNSRSLELEIRPREVCNLFKRRWTWQITRTLIDQVMMISNKIIRLMIHNSELHTCRTRNLCNQKSQWSKTPRVKALHLNLWNNLTFRAMLFLKTRKSRMKIEISLFFETYRYPYGFNQIKFVNYIKL